jgi:hypothetical protein
MEELIGMFYDSKKCIILTKIRICGGVAQSVECLTTDWMIRVQSLAEAKDFSCSLCVQTSPEAHPASCT